MQDIEENIGCYVKEALRLCIQTEIFTGAGISCKRMGLEAAELYFA